MADTFTSGVELDGGTIAVGQTPGTITVTFPTGGANGIPTGFLLDPDSVTDLGRELVDQDPGTPGIQVVVSGGWVVTLDETRAITRIGSTNQFLVPVTVTAADNTDASPLLEGVNVADLRYHGSLYQVLPLRDSAAPLLIGSIEGAPPEPIAW